MKTDHRGYVLASETAPCMKCGTPTDINLLDAKAPRGGNPDRGANFTRLECEPCYGPGWLPMATTKLRAAGYCLECGGYGWLAGGDPDDDMDIMCQKCGGTGEAAAKKD